MLPRFWRVIFRNKHTADIVQDIARTSEHEFPATASKDGPLYKRHISSCLLVGSSEAHGTDSSTRHNNEPSLSNRSKDGLSNPYSSSAAFGGLAKFAQVPVQQQTVLDEHCRRLSSSATPSQVEAHHTAYQSSSTMTSSLGGFKISENQDLDMDGEGRNLSCTADDVALLHARMESLRLSDRHREILDLYNPAVLLKDGPDAQKECLRACGRAMVAAKELGLYRRVLEIYDELKQAKCPVIPFLHVQAFLSLCELKRTSLSSEKRKLLALPDSVLEVYQKKDSAKESFARDAFELLEELPLDYPAPWWYPHLLKLIPGESALFDRCLLLMHQRGIEHERRIWKSISRRVVAGDIPTRIMKIRKAEIAKTPLKELQYFFSSTTETVRLLAPKSERLQAAIDELDLMCDTLMSRQKAAGLGGESEAQAGHTAEKEDANTSLMEDVVQLKTCCRYARQATNAILIALSQQMPAWHVREEWRIFRKIRKCGIDMTPTLYNRFLTVGFKVKAPFWVMEEVRLEMQQKGVMLWLSPLRSFMHNAALHSDPARAQQYLDQAKAGADTAGKLDNTVFEIYFRAQVGGQNFAQLITEYKGMPQLGVEPTAKLYRDLFRLYQDTLLLSEQFDSGTLRLNISIIFAIAQGITALIKGNPAPGSLDLQLINSTVETLAADAMAKNFIPDNYKVFEWCLEALSALQQHDALLDIADGLIAARESQSGSETTPDVLSKMLRLFCNSNVMSGMTKIISLKQQNGFPLSKQDMLAVVRYCLWHGELEYGTSFLHSLDEQHSFADLRFSYWMIRMHLASKDYSAALDILDAASKTQEHQSKHSAGFDVILQMVADCGKRDGREDIIDSVRQKLGEGSEERLKILLSKRLILKGYGFPDLEDDDDGFF